MNFAEHLAELLPPDLPNREAVLVKSAQHLELIVEANKSFNLTRILDLREAAIKHVLDSALPWRLFEGAEHVLDAGTGAGYPGIVLALIHPQIQFTLAESIGKKARFVEAAVQQLKLPNVTVVWKRAEEVQIPKETREVVTARAVAPLERFAGLLAPMLKNGATALLYKGPDGEAEILQATPALQKNRLRARIVQRYELPDALGTRTIIELYADSGTRPVRRETEGR